MGIRVFSGTVGKSFWHLHNILSLIHSAGIAEIIHSKCYLFYPSTAAKHRVDGDGSVVGRWMDALGAGMTQIDKSFISWEYTAK